MRASLAGVLLVLMLAVSGCGAKDPTGSVPAGAEFAPASAAAYVSVATDPDGAQWKAADRLLQRFPGRNEFLAGLRKSFTEQGLKWETDVRPALPPDVNVVWLDFANGGNDVVGYAKPKDQAKFTKILESGSDKQVHRQIDGWTVFAGTLAAIDRFEAARASGDPLPDVSGFSDAIESQPESAAVRGWLSGEAVQAELEKQASKTPGAQSYKQFTQTFGQLESVAFSTGAEEQGVRFEATYKATGQAKAESFSAELANSLPAGALAYVAFGSLEESLMKALENAGTSSPNFEQQRAQLESAFGFSLTDDLFPLLSQEGAVAVYRGSDFMPHVLLALRVPDEAKARKIVGRAGALAALSGGTSRAVTVDGVEVQEITPARSALSYFAAVSDGKAFVTNSKVVLAQALGDSSKLSDDAFYQQARDASGAPDETTGFVYLNLQQGLPFLLDYADDESPGSVPREARDNTKPLSTALFFGKADGDEVTFSGFLTIK